MYSCKPLATHRGAELLCMERPARTIKDGDADGDVGDEGAPVAQRLSQCRLQAVPRR